MLICVTCVRRNQLGLDWFKGNDLLSTKVSYYTSTCLRGFCCSWLFHMAHKLESTALCNTLSFAQKCILPFCRNSRCWQEDLWWTAVAVARLSPGRLPCCWVLSVRTIRHCQPFSQQRQFRFVCVGNDGGTRPRNLTTSSEFVANSECCVSRFQFSRHFSQRCCREDVSRARADHASRYSE